LISSASFFSSENRAFGEGSKSREVLLALNQYVVLFGKIV